MKLNLILFLNVFIISFAFLFSFSSDLALAQVSGGDCTPGSANCSNRKSTDSGFNLDIKVKNPLKVNTIQDAVRLFVNAIVRIAIPILVVFYIWAGISFILARGNSTKLEKAKNMFFYTIIGTLLILGAWTIVNVIIGTVNSIIE